MEGTMGHGAMDQEAFEGAIDQKAIIGKGSIKVVLLMTPPVPVDKKNN